MPLFGKTKEKKKSLRANLSHFRRGLLRHLEKLCQIKLTNLRGAKRRSNLTKGQIATRPPQFKFKKRPLANAIRPALITYSSIPSRPYHPCPRPLAASGISAPAYPRPQLRW